MGRVGTCSTAGRPRPVSTLSLSLIKELHAVITRNQLTYEARNLVDGSWWTCLNLSALGQTLRYIVAIQKVGGAELGVLAVTPYAEVVEDRYAAPNSSEREPDAPQEFRRAFEPTARDCTTLVHSNLPAERWDEIAELIDRTLTAGVMYFADQIG